MRPKIGMCRNIGPSNFASLAGEAEVRSAAPRLVRKISGLNQPSLATEDAFGWAVEEVAAATRLMGWLAQDREVEAQKTRELGRILFAAGM